MDIPRPPSARILASRGDQNVKAHAPILSGGCSKDCAGVAGRQLSWNRFWSSSPSNNGWRGGRSNSNSDEKDRGIERDNPGVTFGDFSVPPGNPRNPGGTAPGERHSSFDRQQFGAEGTGYLHRPVGSDRRKSTTAGRQD